MAWRFVISLYLYKTALSTLLDRCLVHLTKRRLVIINLINFINIITFKRLPLDKYRAINLVVSNRSLVKEEGLKSR